VKQILEHFPRLQSWYNVGPVQRAELAEFAAAICAENMAVTADYRLVSPGDQVWVLAGVEDVVETTVLEPVTAYEHYRPVPVAHSFSTEQAARTHLKYNVN
jgi:hypothetical protein